MVRDTAKIFLRNVFSPYQKIDSSAVYLNSDGTGSFVFPLATNGVSYYLQTKHRNSIETWSKSGGETFSNSVLNYDFTTSANKAYGSNQILLGSKYCIRSGDINQDGTVDASDLSNVDNDAYNSLSGYVRTDVTGDNFVDAGDVSIVDNNAFNSVSSVTP